MVRAGGWRIMFVALGAFFAASSLHAQDYPNRPITLIVPFAAGGSSDVNARLIADQMSRTLGQRIIIENIGGGGGVIALTRAAQATPDGYTLIQGNSGTHTAVYLLYPDVKFTPNDFQPIGMFTKSSAIVALRKNFPARDLSEFMAYAKANPGKVNVGHSGVGSQNYLFCKAFIDAAGIDVTLVGYRGGGPALNDLIGGQIDALCDSSASVTPSIQSGLVRGLVLASKARLPHLPDVPTAAEAGMPQFEIQGGMRYLRRRARRLTSSTNSTRRCATPWAMPIIRSGSTNLDRHRPTVQRCRLATWRASCHRKSRNSGSCWAMQRLSEQANDV